jgi:UPF0042 nucleotide-binding protein
VKDGETVGAPRASTERARRMEFIIVTGMSGAGKTAASRCLEDLGYFCIDNLPAVLLPKVAELLAASEKRIDRVAIVMDAREGSFLDVLEEVLADLAREGHAVRMVFLDASDEALVRRFSESRRPHPLAPGGPVTQGIRAERQRLAQLRAKADVVVDTSGFTVHEFRKLLATSFLDLARSARTVLTLVSFGYRYGLPVDADVVFDARCLPNPHFVETLRPLTGRDAAVKSYVLGFPQGQRYLEHVLHFLQFSLPLFGQEGRAYLTIAIGCTGGRHRSVALIEALADRLAEAGQQMSIRHRDVEREP